MIVVIGLTLVLVLAIGYKYLNKTPVIKPKMTLLNTFPISNTVGSLTVYTGPMFCGKTTHLLQDITRYADTTSCLESRPLLINSKLDGRDSKHIISSHSSSYRGVSDKIDMISVKHLNQVDVSSYTVIGIDEAQFFPDLFETVDVWVKSGKHVYCAGLDGDRHMKKFGQIADLLNISDKFVKLSSICSLCLDLEKSKGKIILPNTLHSAPFTGCIVNTTQEQVQVGGANLYRPVCREHFYSLQS